MLRPIRTLSKLAFAPYGDVLEYSSAGDAGESFQVIVKVPDAVGWRLAVSKLKPGPIQKLGLHPHSRESFEPLSGVALLAVAEECHPEAYELFLLDQPVCLFTNIWHATMALSAQAFVKIAENAEVEGLDYPLRNPIAVGYEP